MKAKMLLIAVLFSGALAFGQSYKGSVSAEITTEDGSPLPGAVAVLSADTFTRSFVSDANGSVRFVGLVPDTYELRVSFTGFNTYVRPNIIVDTGQNVRLKVTMTPSTQQEEMVVTAESPLMDTTKVGTSTVLTEEELNAVPQSRDPWSVIMTVPGVQTDRVNVGGSEAGQQANFASKGDNGDNASWTMDGIEFVDPAARGATQSYLDFSSFQQMSVSTGGSGVEQRSGGAALNFVTKQGSNNHQGSVRLLYADEEFQSSHDGIITNAGAELPGNRIAETFEKAFEIGGPLIKDKLWYWGSFSQNSINQLTINGQEDRTELRNISFKLHGDITATTRFNVFYTEGDKIKNGRGAGNDRPVGTTWDQSGPTPIYKFELSQLIGQHTEIALLAARVDGQFQLVPKGDPALQPGLEFSNFIWEDTTFINYATQRPTRQYEIKGNTYLSSSSLDHELSYGFQYKTATVASQTSYGNDGLIAYFFNGEGFGTGLYREGNAASDIEYMNLYIGDTMTYGNWTFKAGLRYDSQEGNNVASSVNANPFAPEVLPGIAFAGEPVPFTWDTIAPRLGVTYTWGEDNQYLVRGSVSQFYDTLSSGFITPSNPTTVKYSYHQWADDNGNRVIDQGELSGSLANDVNTVLDVIDPDLESPRQDEFILGFEWSVNPEFTVAATYTWRQKEDFTWLPYTGRGPNGLIQTSDYTPITTTLSTGNNANNPLPDGFGEDATFTYYNLDVGDGPEDLFQVDQNGVDGVNAQDYNRILTNRNGYSEDFTSIELTATKRLSNRWMMRANIALQDWTRNVDPSAIQNPIDFASGFNEDGAAVGIQSAGSGNRANVFFGSAGWTFNVNGLYQLPWDVTVSTNINGREGFASPYFYRFRVPSENGRPFQSIKFGTFDEYRFDDLFWADFKLTKTFHMGGRTKVEVAAEIFNAFNDDTYLARELRLGLSTTNQPAEVLSPRVGRFSATVHF